MLVEEAVVVGVVDYNMLGYKLVHRLEHSSFRMKVQLA